VSKLSSSVRPAPQSGRYQPGGAEGDAGVAGHQGTPPLEDAADGPHRGHASESARSELAVDRPSAVLAQDTRLLEFTTHGQHGILYGGFGSTSPSRDRRMVAPIDLF